MTEPVDPGTIAPLPVIPPSFKDPANFEERGDAVIGALPTLISEINSVAAKTKQNADTAKEQAQISTEAAATTAGAGEAAMRYRDEAKAARDTVVPAAAAVLQDRERAETAATATARDAQFVADKLQEISGGPVASFNGRGGAVKLGLNDVMAVAPAATQQELEEAESAELRLYSPADIRAAIMGAATPLSQVLEPLMPSDHQPGDVIEATSRAEPKFIKLGKDYLISAYPQTWDRNIDRLPWQQTNTTIGDTSSMPYSVTAVNDALGVLFLRTQSRVDRFVRIDKSTGAHTLTTLTQTPLYSVNYGCTAPDGSIWLFSYDSSSPTTLEMTVYEWTGTTYQLYAKQTFSSPQPSANTFSMPQTYCTALSKNLLLATQSSTYSRGVTYTASGGAITMAGASLLDKHPYTGTDTNTGYLATVSLSPTGKHLLVTGHYDNSYVYRIYRRVTGTNNFTLLGDLPYIPGISWGGYGSPGYCPTWLSDDLVAAPNGAMLEMTDGSSALKTYYVQGQSGPVNRSVPLAVLNSRATRFASGDGSNQAYDFNWETKAWNVVPIDNPITSSVFLSPLQNVFLNDRSAAFTVAYSGSNVLLYKRMHTATFSLKDFLTPVTTAAANIRSRYMRTYDY